MNNMKKYAIETKYLYLSKNWKELLNLYKELVNNKLIPKLEFNRKLWKEDKDLFYISYFNFDISDERDIIFIIMTMTKACIKYKKSKL